MLLDLLDLGLIELALSIFIIFIAYTIKGLSGFGSGLVAIPLLAFMFPLTVIVPVLGLLSYSGTILQSIQCRKQVSWQDMWPLLPFSILGIVIAVWLLVNVDAEQLVMYLAVFVIIYSLYSLMPSFEARGGRGWAIPAGTMAGVVGALFGTGGPFYVIYLKLRQLEKQGFRATIAMIFLVDGGARILAYSLSGLYTAQVLSLLLILLPVLLLGMYAGNHLHIRINQQRFNQVLSLLLLFSGIMLLVKTLA